MNMSTSSLSSSLSVIIVTSPLQSHPHTELIDRLILSLKFLHGFERLHKICALIVTDGVLQPGAAGSKKTKRNAGLNEERIRAYDEYKHRLISRFGRTCESCGCGCRCGARACPNQSSKHSAAAHPPLSWFDFSVTELDGWHGFGWALRYALTLVHTPQVLVLPHDMEFERPIDVASLCAILQDGSNGVEYIGFCNPKNLNYAERVHAKSGIALTPHVFPSAASPRESVPLLPLFRWKENPHVANVAQYKRVVFGPTAWPKVKRGQFLEETIGQRQNDLILTGGGTDGWREAHAAWGTFLYWPSASASVSVKPDAVSDDAMPVADVAAPEPQPMAPSPACKLAPATFAVTHHLDGHTYRTMQMRQAAGHTPHLFEIERSAQAARLFDDHQDPIRGTWCTAID